MRYILILLLFISGAASAQFAPTSAKTKFVNGIAIGSRDTSQFTAADTIALTIARDSVMYYRYRGLWRPIATGGNLSAYKLISDTLFNNGYTTRARLKQGLDSLAATKVNISDTASMLAPYFRDSDTTGLLNQVVRTFGTQTIGGNKTFSNNIVVGINTIGAGAGSQSVLFGNSASANGTRSVAIGAETFADGTRNIAIGAGASGGGSSSSDNTSVGAGAGASLGNFSGNTMIGKDAGRFYGGSSLPLGQAQNSVFVGASTKALTNTDDNTIVIGHQATGNGSNTVTIGNSSVTNNYFSGNIRSSNGTAFLKNMANGSSSDSVIVSNNGELRKIAQSSIVGSGGTVTSVATNNGSGITGGTITSTGTIAADTTILATRAYVVGLDVGKANTSLNNVNGVLSSTYGGAGSVNGILKANGSGVVSAAVAGTDYVAPSALSGYLSLAGGLMTGNVVYKNAAGSNTVNIGADDGMYGGASDNGGIFIYGNNKFIISTNSTRQVAVDGSGNMGIGTLTPAYKLDVVGTANFTGALSGTSLSMSGAGSFGTTLRIGGALKSWDAFEPALQIKTMALGSSGQSNGRIFTNTYYDGNYRYQGTGTATMYEADGGFFWSTAASGVADGLISWVERMRLTTAGNVLIKTTTDNGTDALQVNGSGLFNGRIRLGTNFIGDIGNGSGILFGTTSLFSTDGSDNRVPKDLGASSLRWGTYYGSGGDFSSSVTASSLIKSGGTSAQFLKADGSVDGSTYVNTSSTQSVGGNKTFTSSTVFTGVRFAYSSVSSNYTLTDNDDYINVTSSCTITLPTAVGRSGKRYVIKCVGTVTATIASTSSQTIDGNAASSYSFGGPNFNVLIVYSDGSNWFTEAFTSGS